MVTEQETDFYGKFVFEPLDRGFGHTLGTSLRRILLTAIKGSAPVSVKIEGVSNQFSTIEGMKETVLQFILNLKRLRLKYFGTESATLKFNIVGPGVMTAENLELPSDVEIVNKDLVLANLSDKKTKLSGEITVKSGYGFVAADDQPREGFGIIPMDSLYSPVTRVNYSVDDTRVGRMTNYDKLTLEVWTDGTVKPQEAVIESAKILISYYDQIINPQIQPAKMPAQSLSLAQPALLKMTVEELDLPTRIINSLIKSGIKTIEDLLSLKRAELINIKNMGAKSLSQIEEKLKEKGIVLS